MVLLCAAIIVRHLICCIMAEYLENTTGLFNHSAPQRHDMVVSLLFLSSAIISPTVIQSQGCGQVMTNNCYSQPLMQTKKKKKDQNVKMPHICSTNASSLWLPSKRKGYIYTHCKSPSIVPFHINIWQCYIKMSHFLKMEHYWLNYTVTLPGQEGGKRVQ